MSFKSNPVTLATGSDTTIFEAPATFSGVVQLSIGNVNASSRTYTLKFYKASTAVTTTFPVTTLAGLAAMAKIINFSMEAGDKVIGTASAASSVVVAPVITLGPSTSSRSFVPQGEYAAGTTYALNDVVSIAATGTSYLSMQAANIGNAPASSPSYWMLLAAKGAQGDAGAAGASSLTIVRVVSAGAESYVTDFEAGDAIDGVTLVANDLVLRASAAAPERNGVYVVPASGAAARHSSFATFDSLAGILFSVQEGTTGKDTLWVCTSDKGGTLNTTAITIKNLSAQIGDQATAIASATGAGTTDIWNINGNSVHITGTTGITSFGTAAKAGLWRLVIFDGALTLTHGASTIVLPGGANITTAANDRALVYADTTTKAIVVSYVKASGIPKGGLPTIQSFTTGSAATYTTPANTLWIKIKLWGPGGTGGAGGAGSGGFGGSGGGGGGGGGYVEHIINSPAATYTYTVGTTVGVASTFSGGTLSAGGGSVGGTGAAAGGRPVAGGTGGAASGGNIVNQVGGAGGSGGTQPGANTALGAAGGSGGGGGGGGAGGAGNNGSAGSAPGGGGGGGGGGDNGAGATTGGAAAAGRLVVEEYYS